MNYLKKIFFAISASTLLLSLTILVVEIRTNKALNDYSMLPDGVKVVDKVILGRRPRTLSNGLKNAYYAELRNGISRAFRRDALELICTNKSEVLLVLKISNFRGTIINDRPHLTIKDGSFNGSQVPIKNINYLGSGYFYTVASDPLFKSETTGIIKALEKSNFTTIRFEAMDSSRLFTNNVKVSEVKQLINNCQNK